MALDEVPFQLDPLSLDLISHSDGNAHSGADIDGVSSADSGAESEEDSVDDSDDDSDGLPTGSPRLAIWKLKDEELFTPERERQIEIYLEQLTRSEGFDIDFALLTYWYTFRIQPVVGDEDFHTHLTAWEMVDEVAKYAIDEYNREQGGKLQFEKVMYANWERAMGTMFYITFLAKDLSSPDKEPRL